MWSLAPAGCVSAHRAAQPAACSGRNAPAWPVGCRAALPRQARRVTPQLASRRPSQQRAAAAARRAARGSPASAPRADVGGEYIENYDDVDRTLLNYFTYKAVRMTLAQLVETDTSPGKMEYSWLYQFALDNPPSDGQRFLSELLAVREDFGERILVQRLTVYRRWVKSFSAQGFDEKISEGNRALLVARLTATVNMNLTAADRECVVDGKPEPCPPQEGESGNTML